MKVEFKGKIICKFVGLKSKMYLLIDVNGKENKIDTLETGLSDFHKLTVTVLKTLFKKQSLKLISYRNYKKFSNDSFLTDLINEISSNDILEGDLNGFLDACKKSQDF